MDTMAWFIVMQAKTGPEVVLAFPIHYDWVSIHDCATRLSAWPGPLHTVMTRWTPVTGG